MNKVWEFIETCVTTEIHGQIKDLEVENAELRDRLAKLEESYKNIEAALKDLVKRGKRGRTVK